MSDKHGKRPGLLRKRAWQNPMVASLNAALEQYLFGLTDGENSGLRHPVDCPPCSDSKWGMESEFSVPLAGLTFQARVCDIGAGELYIRVWRDTPGGHVLNAGTSRAKIPLDFSARGVLTRRDPDDYAGLYPRRYVAKLQPIGRMYCKRHLLSRIAAVHFEPAGEYDINVAAPVTAFRQLVIETAAH